MTILSSTISGNVADQGYDEPYASLGGGVAVVGTLNVANSTLVGNRALDSFFDCEGGGVWASASGRAALRHTTVVRNHCDNLFADSDEAFVLANAIVARAAGGSRNCGRAFIDRGGNFADDGSCGPFTPIVAGVDFAEELSDGGGPTETIALLPGSVAIDSGGDCGLGTDQRGFARDAACDGGAFEFGGEEPSAPTLELIGACPGDVAVSVGGATPSGSVFLLWSAEAGLDVVTEGPCLGAVLDLAEPDRSRPLAADAGGEVALTRAFSADQCGLSVQALDVETCSVSPVAVVPK